MMSGRDPVRLGNRTYRAWGKPELPKNLFKTHEQHLPVSCVSPTQFLLVGYLLEVWNSFLSVRDEAL